MRPRLMWIVDIDVTTERRHSNMCSPLIMMMIAFITFKSSLVPLLEGL